MGADSANEACGLFSGGKKGRLWGPRETIGGKPVRASLPLRVLWSTTFIHVMT
ncbi:hypothetical protein RHMOL_Rhmol09G0158000 [Rhododendron molle]|uniref:Uncharacterized protein n=1 Tax=Rhododendron molle TaxID=49168 RepID=A0ACC0MF01_RHOML|nr:hypothetical protein RHMOL_Rhmol09G0158000 [Rhododendron molle]